MSGEISVPNVSGPSSAQAGAKQKAEEEAKRQLLKKQADERAAVTAAEAEAKYKAALAELEAEAARQAAAAAAKEEVEEDLTSIEPDTYYAYDDLKNKACPPGVDKKKKEVEVSLSLTISCSVLSANGCLRVGVSRLVRVYSGTSTLMSLRR